MGRNLETCCRSFAHRLSHIATERSSSCTLLQCHKLSSHIDLSMCVCCCCYYFCIGNFAFGAGFFHSLCAIGIEMRRIGICRKNIIRSPHGRTAYATFAFAFGRFAGVWSGARPARTYAGQKRCPSALKSFNLSGH